MTTPGDEQRNGGRTGRLMTVLIALVAVIGLGFWWLSPSGAPSEGADTPPVTNAASTDAADSGQAATAASSENVANAPTIDIPFSNTNRGFGDFLEGELQAADRDRQRKVAAAPNGVDASGNGASIMITQERRIAPRRFRDLTVTGVGVMHEGHAIYFREDSAAVRRSFAAAGVRIDGEGNVPGTEDEPPYCNINPTSTPEAQALGATALSCGV